MASELFTALFKRRSRLDASAVTFESEPSSSTADASHLDELQFGAVTAKEWLLQRRTPEEDRLADLLTEELRMRGARPAHAPRLDSETDMEHLGELGRTLLEARRQLDEEASKLYGLRDSLSSREAEVTAREKALVAEQERLREQDELRKSYPVPLWLERLEGTVNVAVVGNSGVGKSLLVNRLRRVQPGSDDWAPVGVKETTLHPRMYAFPGQPLVRLWDLPGAGTSKFPSATYVSGMGLRHFDAVLCVTAGRFTQTELEIAEELKGHGVPHFMVRTKVDIDMWNNQEDNQVDGPATLAKIVADLRQRGVAQAYLVSARQPLDHDFPKLVGDIFPCLRKLVDPEETGDGWDDPWAMPEAHSTLMSGIQGRWTTGSTWYQVHGAEVHVTRGDGSCATATIEEKGDRLWWIGQWYVDRSAMTEALSTGQLTWKHANGARRPFCWWWNE